MEAKILSNTVVLMGGLGNQLFQLAAVLYVSPGQEYNLISDQASCRRNSLGAPEVSSFFENEDIKFQRNWRLGFVLQKVANRSIRASAVSGRDNKFVDFKQLAKFCFKIFRREQLLITNGTGFDPQLDFVDNPVTLVGYFQSYRYASNPNVYPVLQRLKLPDRSLVLQEKISESKRIQPLLVHMRFGDYLNEKGFGVLSPEYYAKAFQLAFTKEQFKQIWLFSDDVEIALSYIPSEFIGLVKSFSGEDFNTSETFELMRYAGSYIIANSTFSWWAAFLSKSDSPLIICPNPWFRDSQEPDELIPPNWIRLSGW